MKIKVGEKRKAYIEYRYLLGNRKILIKTVEGIEIRGLIFKVYICKIEDDEEDGEIVQLYEYEFVKETR